MTGRWEITTLDKISENLDSKRIPITKGKRSPGGIPYYGASGVVDFVSDHLFDEDLLCVSEDGANLLARTYPIAFSINGKSWVNNHAHVLRFKDKTTQRFVEAYLNHISLAEFVSGMAQPKLNQAMLNRIPIPFPPLSDQKRIVAILDEAFVAIDKAKANADRNLKNAKELFESYVQELLGKTDNTWALTRLGDICKINDGTHFSPKNISVGDYMYITAKNIKPYNIDLSNISYVSKKDHAEIYTRCSPVKGDVLYIKDGATAGIASINTLEEEFSMLSSVALLKCSDKILNTFLVHYMNSQGGKKNFLGYIDGAAITRLTLVKIKNVCLPLPPVREQQTIVRHLDRLRSESQKLESIYCTKLKILEELKKSLLQKAFTGKITKESMLAEI
jgi:type I restriction enzyme, S subunit